MLLFFFTFIDFTTITEFVKFKFILDNDLKFDTYDSTVAVVFNKTIKTTFYFNFEFYQAFKQLGYTIKETNDKRPIIRFF